MQAHTSNMSHHSAFTISVPDMLGIRGLPLSMPYTHTQSLFLVRSVSVHTFARETRCLKINFVITLVFAIYHFSTFWHRLRFIVWFNPTHYSSTASHWATEANSGWIIVVEGKKMRAVRIEMGNDVKPPPKWRMIKWKSGPEPLSNASTLFYDSTLIGRSYKNKHTCCAI